MRHVLAATAGLFRVLISFTQKQSRTCPEREREREGGGGGGEGSGGVRVVL